MTNDILTIKDLTIQIIKLMQFDASKMDLFALLCAILFIHTP